MNILLYYQHPYRSIFLESLVQSFIQKGHRVYFLTTCERGILHEKMEEMGAIISVHNPGGSQILQILSQWKYLIRYCKQNKIEVIYSHLQYVNLIALLARYFINARVFPCRHHVDEVQLVGNRNAMMIDKLVNLFLKSIIVVSQAVKRQMVLFEKVKPHKISVIPLGYNFDLYDKPDPLQVSAIREKLDCNFILIVISRMTVHKRHIVTLEVLDKLVKDGMDVKLLILGQGDEEQNLKEFVNHHQLNNRVIFTGFLNNTMDYLAAADLLLNPSVIEASNQVFKEAALLFKPSVVCSGIGDFDEYVVHCENGFLVSKNDTINEMYEIVKEFYFKKEELKVIGARIRDEVILRFDIRQVSKQYLELNH